MTYRALSSLLLTISAKGLFVLEFIFLLHEDSEHVVGLDLGLICTRHYDVVARLQGNTLDHLAGIREVVAACDERVLVKVVLG